MNNDFNLATPIYDTSHIFENMGEYTTRCFNYFNHRPIAEQPYQDPVYPYNSFGAPTYIATDEHPVPMISSERSIIRQNRAPIITPTPTFNSGEWNNNNQTTAHSASNAQLSVLRMLSEQDMNTTHDPCVALNLSTRGQPTNSHERLRHVIFAPVAVKPTVATESVIKTAQSNRNHEASTTSTNSDSIGTIRRAQRRRESVRYQPAPLVRAEPAPRPSQRRGGSQSRGRRLIRGEASTRAASLQGLIPASSLVALQLLVASLQGPSQERSSLQGTVSADDYASAHLDRMARIYPHLTGMLHASRDQMAAAAAASAFPMIHPMFHPLLPLALQMYPFSFNHPPFQWPPHDAE